MRYPQPITFRVPSAEDREALEAIRERTGCGTTNKAAWLAIREWEHWKDRARVAERELTELRRRVAAVSRASEALDEARRGLFDG